MYLIKAESFDTTSFNEYVSVFISNEYQDNAFEKGNKISVYGMGNGYYKFKMNEKNYNTPIIGYCIETSNI